MHRNVNRNIYAAADVCFLYIQNDRFEKQVSGAQVPGFRCQVASFRCQVRRFQVPGPRCQVPGSRFHVLGVNGQVSDARLQAPCAMLKVSRIR